MKYIFANWKMYLDFDETMILTNQLLQSDFDVDDLTLALFPNTLAFTEVEKACRNSFFSVGAQNVQWTPKGAYTGGTSAVMFKDAGARYALVGHSERRHIFGETNDDVHKKMEACIDAGLTPILCIGETADDRAEGKREYRLKKQLTKALEGLDVSRTEFLVAYEPVWAISSSGEGEACEPDQAGEIHAWIKQELRVFKDTPIPILYGGSIHGGNVVSYVSHEAIDGVLIGYASVSVETFSALVHAVLAQ